MWKTHFRKSQCEVPTRTNCSSSGKEDSGNVAGKTWCSKEGTRGTNWGTGTESEGTHKAKFTTSSSINSQLERKGRSKERSPNHNWSEEALVTTSSITPVQACHGTEHHGWPTKVSSWKDSHDEEGIVLTSHENCENHTLCNVANRCNLGQNEFGVTRRTGAASQDNPKIWVRRIKNYLMSTTNDFQAPHLPIQWTEWQSNQLKCTGLGDCYPS